MKNPSVSSDGLSLENRLEQARKRARRETTRLFPVMLVLYTVMLITIAPLLGYSYRHDYLRLGIGLGLAFLTACGLKVVSDRQKHLFEPTKKQRVAIETAIDQLEYDKAMRLTEEMLLRTAGGKALELAAFTYLRAGKVFEGHLLCQEAVETYKHPPSRKSRKSEIAEHKRRLSNAKTLLGLALMMQQRYAESELVLLEAMETDPSYEWPIINYVEALLYQQRSVPVVFDSIDKATALSAKNNQRPKAAHATARAWAYALEGNRSSVEKWANEAIRIAAERNQPAVTSEVYYIVGLAYQALGDDDEARHAFNRAIDADPKGFAAQLAARCLQ